jgi:hypothetical protein
MGRRLAAISFIAAFVAALLMPSAASASNRQVGMLGPVLRRGASASAADTLASRVLDLRYHRGRIIQSNTVHAVFWGTFDTTYVQAIETYFDDVAAASGATDNVYSVATQYFDKRPHRPRRHIAYAVTHGADISDVSPYPRSGCSPGRTYTNCLTDRQIQTELRKVAPVRGLNNIYFVFLPPAVDTCIGAACADRVFCAYHSAFHTRVGWIVYANQPFGNVHGCETNVLPQPNGAAVDNTLNLVSHEHNEAITDPIGNAWFNRFGDEQADICARRFGTTAPDGSNQTINAHPYQLQEEWGNASHDCLQGGH